MRQSTYIHASQKTDVITRWRGMGAVLAIAFYSLFFAAHQQFRDSPIYVRDGLLFGAESQTVFQDLTTTRTGNHRQIGPEHSVFTLLHQGPTQALIHGWQWLGQDLNQAKKYSVALLTCLAGALTVVMVYHSLLWSGVVSLRAVMISVICGASTCLFVTAPLPEVWVFAGLGLAALMAVTARGALAPWWLHGLVSIYAIGCFVGNVLPALLMALARCAYDSSQQQRFIVRPLLVVLVAITVSFGLANLQRVIYPQSTPLPTRLTDWKIRSEPWISTRENAGLVSREVFLANIVAPRVVSTEADNGLGNRRRVVLAGAAWPKLNFQNGIMAGWLLLLALAFAGLVWRAQMDPFTLGIVSILVWCLAALPWYGDLDRLLVQACLWTPAVVIAVGLGLERSLEHWPRAKQPITFLLVAFVCTQITRNWMFLQEVVAQLKSKVG